MSGRSTPTEGAVLDSAIKHKQNEESKQAGHGLHKWNFRAVADEFVIERAGRAVNVTRELATSAALSCTVDGDDSLVVLLLKRQ